MYDKLKSLGKHDFEQKLYGLADTILWEVAREVIRLTEGRLGNPNDPVHWQNRYIYSQFCNRNKIAAYYNAYNLETLAMGKHRSQINS